MGVCGNIFLFFSLFIFFKPVLKHGNFTERFQYLLYTGQCLLNLSGFFHFPTGLGDIKVCSGVEIYFLDFQMLKVPLEIYLNYGGEDNEKELALLQTDTNIIAIKMDDYFKSLNIFFNSVDIQKSLVIDSFNLKSEQLLAKLNYYSHPSFFFLNEWYVANTFNINNLYGSSYFLNEEELDYITQHASIQKRAVVQHLNCYFSDHIEFYPTNNLPKLPFDYYHNTYGYLNNQMYIKFYKNN